jgi:hypothetical protein
MVSPNYSKSTPSKEQRRHRYPLQDLRVNPFAHNEQSYPGLDHAFKTLPSSTSPLSPDRSSSVISAHPSDLNMSIGARAAITEHTRHIARYGLDGESPTLTPSSSPNQSDAYSNNHQQQRQEHQHQEHHHSDEWDRLMDGTSMSHASFSSTFIFENSKNQTLNITCDQSSDFFNSSRVALLATPEKNKAKVDEASRLARLGGIGLRRNGNGEGICLHSHLESISGSSEVSDSRDQSGMIGLFNAAMKFGEKNDHNVCNSIIERYGDEDDEEQESFVSYQEPNLSLLSYHARDISSSEFDNKMKKLSNTNDHSDEIDNKAPSDFFQLDLHDYQESSFISYHEPDLSMVSNTHDNEISMIRNNHHEQNIIISSSHDVIHSNNGGNHALQEYLVDDNESDFIATSNILPSRTHTDIGDDEENNKSGKWNEMNQGVYTPPRSSYKSGIKWANPTLNDRNLNNIENSHNVTMSQTGTASDFYPIFSHIDYSQERMYKWEENETRSTTNNDGHNDDGKSEWESTNPHQSIDWKHKSSTHESTAKLDEFKEFNITDNMSDVPNTFSHIDEPNTYTLRDWSENRAKIPSPQKSEFNVDVSEIRTASECDSSRFARAKMIMKQTLLNNAKFNHSHDRTSHNEVTAKEEIPNNAPMRLSGYRERDLIGLSPIAGHTPSELDSAQFKNSSQTSSLSTSSSRSLRNKIERKKSFTIQSSLREQQSHNANDNAPHVSRLKERYSRLDRFEDSYAISLNDNYQEEGSVSRSLLDTFEYASDKDSQLFARNEM